MIIRGDNLEVLKALLPRYEGRVKCIYIDPPYNTGNEGWVYNDNVNDPKIKKWLGEVVGKEGEDLTRHDKWLCMMYPQLKLLQKLLAEGGVIFISIDDNELFALRFICDEIFGKYNYVSMVTRPTGTHTGVTNKAIVGESDYILVYAKKIETMGVDGIPLQDKDTKIYDMEDERGRFLIRPLRRTDGENRREDRPNMYFPITAPDGTEVYPIDPTGYESRWICNPDGYKYFKDEGRIFWKRTADGSTVKWQVYQKFYLIINQLNPLVIVDESHHARSDLSLEMLENFNPCFVLDLTATPKKESNIISYVDACRCGSAKDRKYGQTARGRLQPGQ